MLKEKYEKMLKKTDMDQYVFVIFKRKFDSVENITYNLWGSNQIKTVATDFKHTVKKFLRIVIRQL